jgi:putative heavy-metal chelation protein
MKLNNRLYDLFCGYTRKVNIETLNIGLGYTVIETSFGGMGLSYTYFESKISCQLIDKYKEQGPAGI